mgnify:CR=1 FL=1
MRQAAAGRHPADEDSERKFDETGRILRDNVYGTIDEDVWRRDFTANSLYYNIADFSIWDYVGGVEDIAARRLRLIGDPETRFREDPVRMLRAARFEAKLGFEIDPETADARQRVAIDHPHQRSAIIARRVSAGEEGDGLARAHRDLVAIADDGLVRGRQRQGMVLVGIGDGPARPGGEAGLRHGGQLGQGGHDGSSARHQQGSAA